jgi:hypothetical protein
MVKRLKFEDFIHQLDSFYSASKDKYSVYLTFKRVYQENFKFKNNNQNRKKRNEDRIQQDRENNSNKSFYDVLVRAKFKKNRVHTILKPEELDKFHHILMNVLTLHFIREENKGSKKAKMMPHKKMSKTKRRKLKRIHKIKKAENTQTTEKIQAPKEVGKK